MSLRYRIALTIFVLEAAMMAVVLWQSLTVLLEGSRQELAATDRVILESLTDLGRSALLAEDYAALQAYFERLREDPHLHTILLADARRRVVAASSPARLGTRLDPGSAVHGRYWRLAPILDAAGTMGAVAVEFSSTPFAGPYRRARNAGIVFAAGGMLIIAFVGLAMGRLLTRRLDRLVTAAKALGAGRSGVRARVPGHDEVARLGRVFDSMARRIEGQRAALETLNRDLERRVQVRTRDLSKLLRDMESFSYSVSHDLRAPVRAIDGYCAALLEDVGDRLPEPGRRYVECARAAAHRMAALIEDLLVLARLSREAVRSVPVDLAPLAREVLAALVEQGGAAPAPQVDIPHTLPAYGDRRLLRILLEQLLGNALKYTAGGVRPRIEFNVQDEGSERIYFVRDNGIGFDMQRAEGLFEPFRRLHEGAYPGTGIGLAIARRIVERHGGRIRAEGELGRGATIFFTLPGAGDSVPVRDV